MDEAIVRLALHCRREAVRPVEELADANRVSGSDIRVDRGRLDEVGERTSLDELHRDEEVFVGVVSEVVHRRHHAVGLLKALLQHRPVPFRSDALP